MFYDHATISLKAGNGGDGAMHMRREKYVSLGGPDGGDGGRGGSIYLEGDANQNTLISFRFKRHFVAPDGTKGGRRNSHGRAGQDTVIRVPLGTVVHDATNGELLGDVTEPKQRVLIARGGRGGLGNTHFKTATHQTPEFAQRGEPGQKREVALELRVIADVGLVGYPNAGKSSFLAAVSAARPKVAAYPFTTLEPNLGVVGFANDSFVLADIPGLIEGASDGAGLGLQFLRHIERTRLLLHIIDVAGVDGRADPIGDFHRINTELKRYSESLATRPQIVLANKLDLPEAQEAWPEFRAEMASLGIPVFPLSAATREGVDNVLRAVIIRLNAMNQADADARKADVDSFAVGPGFERYTPAPRDRARDFRVEKKDDEFVVSGEPIDRLVAMIDVHLIAGQAYLKQRLRQLGVIASLDELGIKTGDTVVLGSERIRWGPPEPPPKRRSALSRKLGVR